MKSNDLKYGKFEFGGVRWGQSSIDLFGLSELPSATYLRTQLFFKGQPVT